jgi:zinc-ribbon domain
MFGEANPIAVGLFLGIVFFVPAVLLGVCVLLSLAAGSVSVPKASSNLYLDTDQLLGVCPNCREEIPLDSNKCFYCGAIFGEHSAWSVLRRIKES